MAAREASEILTCSGSRASARKPARPTRKRPIERRLVIADTVAVGLLVLGLLVRILARTGQRGGLERVVRDSPGESEFGIFDIFPGESGREAYLSGRVAAALMENAGEFFEEPIIEIDLIAAKLKVEW